eukprot:SAG22_NODE_12361_length_445_cov_1.193642_2_plen_23_part_01
MTSREHEHIIVSMNNKQKKQKHS